MFKDYWMGIDIGGTKCAVILARLDNDIKIINKICFETKTQNGFEYTYELLCQYMEELLEKSKLTFSQVNAIGISCGGPLNSSKGIILCPPNLLGWLNIPLPQMLKDRYGVPAFIQNDANACALVEWMMGAGRGTQNMIFLTMGTGMGAGIIAEGKLLRGHTNMAGEVGHLRLTEDGPIGFGKAGSFEGYASGGGIYRQAIALTKHMIEQGNPPAWIRDGHSLENVNPKLMADYAHAGDIDAKEFYNEVGRMLGRGIALIVDSFNPECIVIGSIFLRCEDLLRTCMEEELKKEAISFSLEGLRVVPAETGEELGDYAGIIAALYAMNVDLIKFDAETDKHVLAHYERLFERYPSLEICREQVMQAYMMIRNCYQNEKKVLITGNGGSCADAEHIVGELMKGFYLKRPLTKDKKDKIRALTETLLPGTADWLQQGLPAMVLTGHTALSTATQNDLDPNLATAQQVVGYGVPGDVIIGISTSGNAKNVILAVSTAKALGLKTIGLSGGSGGMLAKLCDSTIIVPATTPADVQEYHLPVYHTLCAMLEAKFFMS